MNTRSAYIKAKRAEADRKASLADPMNMKKMMKAEPKGLKGMLGAKKKFFDDLAKERNKMADKQMMLNRLPNAASGYKDFPDNRK